MSRRDRVFVTLLSVWGVGLSFAATVGARADGDLVAPPLGLARLRQLLESCVSPPPSAEELTVVVGLHADMVDAYGAAREGSAGDAWRTGNSMYEDMLDLKRDPSRAGMKEVIRLQERMLVDADAAERTMFESIAVVLAADEPDDARREAVRAQVERARAIREADRLLASFPLREPSGVRHGLHEAVERLRLPPEMRAQLDPILAERDASLAPALRHELREYQSFAIAAAAAFDEIFGVLPPIGAALSDDQVQWLRTNMRQRCEKEGEAFLAARRSVRAREDATMARLSALLPREINLEFQLRLSPSIEGSSYFLLLGEGHVRDALRELPADSPTRQQVEQFAPRWRTALLESTRSELDAARTREDTTFWSPTSARGLGLEMDAQFAGESGHQALLVELDRILAPAVVAAGGKLGNLQAEQTGSGGGRLLERATMSAWRQELANEAAPAVARGTRLGLVDLVAMSEDTLSPECAASLGLIRRGIPSRLDQAAITVLATDTALDAACFAAAWSTYETRWNIEVEAAIAPLTEARRVLREFDNLVGLRALEGFKKADEIDARSRALTRALVLRDSAWRAAEATDEALFQAMRECVKVRSEPDRHTLEVARFARFLERERSGVGYGDTFSKLDLHPDWISVVRGAGLDAEAQARVERRLIELAPRFAQETIAQRQLAFDATAAMDATWLGLRNSALFRSKSHSRSEHTSASNRFAFASADLLAALLSTANEGSEGAKQRALLEASAIDSIYREWSVDPVVQRTASLAARVAETAEERAAIARVVDDYRRAYRASHEHAARLALASSVFHQSSDGTVLFAVPAQAATAGSTEHLAAALARQQADLRATLDIDLLTILGRDRWKKVAPPDLFELLGVCGDER